MPPPSLQTQEQSAELTLGGDRRMTRQRKEIYDLILEKRDHPTATEVFIRAKERIPAISLATVYNCLETLTRAGLVRQVNHDRAPSRYCPNLTEHGHFYCESCGAVSDVAFRGEGHEAALKLPRGAVVDHIDVTIKGRCPDCARREKARR